MEVFEAFNSDVAKLPQWVQIWLNVLPPIILLSTVILLFSKSTRKIALVGLILLILGVFGVVYIYSQMGMVRLLGLGHILFWGPLLWMLVSRLRVDPPPGFFKIAMIVLSTGLAAMLFFDVIDVVRWVIGARGLIV